MDKINFNNKDLFLFIFKCKRLDFGVYIGDNELKNESEITLIRKELFYTLII